MKNLLMGIKMTLDIKSDSGNIKSKASESYLNWLSEIHIVHGEHGPLEKILSKSPQTVNMAYSTRKQGRNFVGRVEQERRKFIVRAKPRAVEGITI